MKDVKKGVVEGVRKVVVESRCVRFSTSCFKWLEMLLWILLETWLRQVLGKWFWKRLGKYSLKDVGKVVKQNDA